MLKTTLTILLSITFFASCSKSENITNIDDNNSNIQMNQNLYDSNFVLNVANNIDIQKFVIDLIIFERDNIIDLQFFKDLNYDSAFFYSQDSLTTINLISNKLGFSDKDSFNNFLIKQITAVNNIEFQFNFSLLPDSIKSNIWQTA